MSTPAWMSPPAVAKLFGIDAGKVNAWIKAGQLVAVNVAKKSTGKPRWRISSAALDQFLQARQSRPPTPKAPRRQRLAPAVKEYV